MVYKFETSCYVQAYVAVLVENDFIIILKDR